MHKPIILPFLIHDGSFPRQDLIYFDANNLYGWAMSQFLPIDGFCFPQQEEISTLKLQDHSDNDEDSYILEVDLHYPASLHNHHNDYPLAPESLVIGRSMYSPTQQSVFPESALQKKLNTIKSSMLFRPKAYIDLTHTSVHSLGIFLQDFFKLMNYSVLGKTQENLRNSVHVELVTDTRLA